MNCCILRWILCPDWPNTFNFMNSILYLVSTFQGAEKNSKCIEKCIRKFEVWLWNNQSEIYLYKSVIQQLLTTPSNSFWILYIYILMDLYWISYIHSTTYFYYFIFHKQFSQGCARYMNLNLVWNLNLLYITRDTWLITSTISSRVNILEFPCIPLTMRVFLVSVS